MPRTNRTPKKDWAAQFFTALEETHLVSEAVKRAGVARSTAYKRRDEDEAFRERWLDVEERSTELLEQIAVRRAAQGSDVLLIFLLKSRRPERYRDHHQVQHTGADGGPVNVRVELDEQQREALGDVLRGRPASRAG